MFKSSKEFEQCAVKFLGGILEGKFKFQDYKDIINDEQEYNDVLDFAYRNQMLLGVEYKTNGKVSFYNIEKDNPPRLSYNGLKFYDEYKNE